MSIPQKRPRRSTPSMIGHWAIVEMDEFDESYFDLGGEPPYLTITASGTDSMRGEYAIGLSTGSLDGALREFGGETVFIFGYAGMDEMDEVDGAGWARLTGPGTLAGEFLGVLGRFEARRQAPRSALATGRRLMRATPPGPS